MQQIRELDEAKLRAIFAKSGDVQIEKYPLGQNGNMFNILLVYCSGLADRKQINQLVLPALEKMVTEYPSNHGFEQQRLLPMQRIGAETKLEQMALQVYSGQLILYFESSGDWFQLNIANPPHRSPDESATEVSIKGPRDGFIEDLNANMALIRKRLLTQSLCCELFRLGQRSHTQVALLYIDDIIDLTIVDDVRNRVQQVDLDALTSSAKLEELLSDSPYALFPLIDHIGRPDYAVECLLRGRFVIVVDGSPMVLIGPATFFEILKTPEDIHFPYFYVSFQRIIRIVGAFIAVFLPGFYVALIGYQIDQLPIPLLASVSILRTGLPASGPMDLFLMVAMFELFREAGLRLPKPVGQTVAVVGGLIIGDSAIRAGLTSPLTVVIVAVSLVASYLLINQTLVGAVTLARLFVLIVSITFGMFGFITSFISIVLYLSTLHSFGIAYLSPISPLSPKEVIAAFLQKPWKRTAKRSKILNVKDTTRRDEGS